MNFFITGSTCQTQISDSNLRMQLQRLVAPKRETPAQPRPSTSANNTAHPQSTPRHPSSARGKSCSQGFGEMSTFVLFAPLSPPRFPQAPRPAAGPSASPTVRSSPRAKQFCAWNAGTGGHLESLGQCSGNKRLCSDVVQPEMLACPMLARAASLDRQRTWGADSVVVFFG